MSILAHLLFTLSIMGVALFLYGIMYSNLQLRSTKFIWIFSIGSTVIQWGSTLVVLWLQTDQVVQRFPILPTSLLSIVSFLFYYLGYKRLQNIEDRAIKSLKLMSISLFVSTFGLLIQLLYIGFVLGFIYRLQAPMVITVFFNTFITFFLIMRILQQITIDQDGLFLPKPVRIVLSFLMATMVNTLVMGIVDIFSLLPNKLYLVLGMVSTFLLILFTVIYGEKQYDRKNLDLHFLAYHDQLTSLKNRIYLQKKLDEMVRAKQPFQLLFIDLDHFKQINDVHGHHIGDRVLQVVANRFLSFKEITTIARIGGDEFTLISNVASAAEMSTLAKRLIQVLSEPIVVNNNSFQVTSSIGISIFPKDGDHVDELMKKADLAMYQAKSAGRDMYWLFDEALEQNLTNEMELKRDLVRAIEKREFSLHYQPLIELTTQRVNGFEALIRWNHPTKGLIQPLSFVKMAEDSGLIVEIGEWVLEEACRQMVDWNKRYNSNYSVSVNLSLKQFGKKNIFEVVDRTLKHTGLNPRLLNLEITESTIMVDPDYTVSTIKRLSDLGVKISIDDFGTGYSSLSYLKQFHIQSLKIDRSFINDVIANEQDSAIVNAILSMAKSLGLEVVAEGVEHDNQKQYLQEQQCKYAQGYLFSKPLHPRQMEIYLETQQQTTV